MAINMDQLKKMLNALELRYYLDPQRDAAMLSAAGHFGQYQCVILLEAGGAFLQIRSVSYAHCPTENPHLLPVLKMLGEINYKSSVAKFGWDRSDGEIIVYVDTWLQDGTVTQSQFTSLIKIFFTAVDLGFPRLQATIANGKDPGNINPENLSDVLQREGSSLPPAVRALLENVLSKKTRSSDAGDLSHI